MQTFKLVLLIVRVKRINGYAWIEMKDALQLDVIDPVLLCLST
jgi:hypothetical protein